MSGTADGLVTHADGVVRCWWCGEAADYVAYHDTEWGRPSADDRYLFEKLCLEGFQSGLSWLTILRKRANFRRAMADFEPARLARFGPQDVERLLVDPGIVRHRGKIESAINNAKRATDLIDEAGSLARFVWRFEPNPSSRPSRFDKATLTAATKSPESVALSKELKRRGWSFVGPTTMYAFMQAVGLVNDHLDGCTHRAACLAERTRFRVPA